MSGTFITFRRSTKHRYRGGSMIQIGCRLWNLSLISVLILTLCNILLTIRLLHSECPITMLPDPPPPPPPRPQLQQPPRQLQFPLHVEPLPSCPLCNNTNNNNLPLIDVRLGRWDSRHLYKMFDNVVVGEMYIEVSQKHSVCIATQSSLEKLHSLVQVAHQWTGPISAALYAAGDQEYKLLQGYVAFLRRCYTPIRERVAFHLALPKEKLPSRHVTAEKTDNYDCLHPEFVLKQLLRQQSSEMVRWRTRNPYPQNHLRNLARRNCQTSYMFLTDIDIIPSANLAEGLNAFLKTARCMSGLCAYVIPTYELDERVRFPHNKTDLIRLTHKGLAQPFHYKVFIYNQYATNFSLWEDDLIETVHISHNVTNFEFLYEPFYVAPDTVPAHDERFIGYGFTRNTQGGHKIACLQSSSGNAAFNNTIFFTSFCKYISPKQNPEPVYEMFVAGYQFQVLSPVFTCHWGLQSRKGRPSWREKQNNINRRNFDVFKREVYAKYHKDPLHMVFNTRQTQPHVMPRAAKSM